METRFQTSFIPKKPIIAQESVRVAAPTSIFMVLGVLAFVVSLGAAGASFFVKDYLESQRVELDASLAHNQRSFDVPLIEELKKANTKIDLANELLKNHVAVSEALNIVGALTAEKVRFSSFEISSSDGASSGAPSGRTTYRIRMRGTADSFNSVAFQSDVFSRSQKYGTNKVLKNPVLSDLAVDADGGVGFFFTAEISPDDLSYIKLFQPN